MCRIVCCVEKIFTVFSRLQWLLMSYITELLCIEMNLARLQIITHIHNSYTSQVMLKLCMQLSSSI